MTQLSDIHRVNVLGTLIHALTEQQVVDLVESMLLEKRKIRIGVVNAAKLVAMQSNKALKDDVESSDLILADGMSVVWASKLLGNPLPERVAGVDIMFRFFELANKHKFSVYCLGATEEVSSIVEDKFRADYPSAVFAGRQDGYFSDDQAEVVANKIAESKPTMLFVAITSPRKENFMGDWDERMNVPLVHGVGGSFDVYSGKVERAPESWQRWGMEWAYRVKQEPGRLWKRYAKTNFTFLWLILKQLVSK